MSVDWRDTFREVPGALGAVLREIFAADDADAAPRWRNGTPKPAMRTAQDVHDALHPKFSNEPFALAVKKLNAPSLRALAERSGMSHTQLQMLVDGRRGLTKYHLELIAKGAKVDPGYFLEYRRMFIEDMVGKMVDRDPAVGVGVYRAMANSLKGRR